MSPHALRIGVVSEDLVDPLGVEGYVDENGRLIGPSAASTVDTHSHNDPDVAVLTNQRTTVIPLTHAFIPPPSSTDLSVADVKAASVHILASFVADNRQVDCFELFVMARTFSLSPAIHFTYGSLWDGAAGHGELDRVDVVCWKCRF